MFARRSLAALACTASIPGGGPRCAETYVGGSVVTPEAGLNVVAPLSRRWSLGGVARY